MRIFDTHVQALTLEEMDLENLAYFGTSAGILVPPRTERFVDAAGLGASLEDTVGRELVRARTWGLQLGAAVGVHPDVRPTRAFTGIWDTLERLVQLPQVWAIGVLGRDGLPAGDRWLEEQLDLARRSGLPAIVDVRGAYTHDDVAVTLDAAREVGLDPKALVLMGIDYASARQVAASGAIAGLALGGTHAPPADAARLVRRFGDAMRDRWVVASATAAERTDVLATARFAGALVREGVATNDIDRVLWSNAVEVFSAGRLAP